MARPDEETMALKTLRSRIRTTLQHLELVDACLHLADKTAGEVEDKRQTLLKSLGVPGKYETLQLPTQQVRQVTNFSRGENLELALLAVYAHFMDYLRTVLPHVHQRHPLAFLFAGVAAEEASGPPSWERVLQRFEGRGGIEELIGRIVEGTGIAIDPETGREAHAYLAMRDLYVYNGGLVDEQFARFYGTEWNTSPGNKLPKNLKIGRSAMHAVERMGVQLDAALRRLGADAAPPAA
jgi:hypothetical protein